MKAHSGYIIGVGVVIPFAAFFGLLAFLANLIPMAAIGIIHSANLHWPEFSGITIGYFIVALFLLIYPRLVEVEHMDSEDST